MFLESSFGGERFSTVITLEWLSMFVVTSDVHVHCQLLLECSSTHLVLVMSVSCVTSHVYVEVEFLLKHFSTHLAIVDCISSSRSYQF